MTLTDLHPFYTYSCAVAAETVAVGPYTFPITVQLSEEGWWNDYEIYQDDAVASYTKFKLEANFIIIIPGRF